MLFVFYIHEEAFQFWLKETMILLQVPIEPFNHFLKRFPFCCGCRRISWSKTLTRVCMRPLGWLFPVSTSGWRLDFIATVYYPSQQRASISPNFALVGEEPATCPQSVQSTASPRRHRVSFGMCCSHQRACCPA